MRIFEFGKAICYSGYREGQRPGGVIPSMDEIREDIHILCDEGYKYLRMYDPNLHAKRVLQVITEDKLPMKCIIGVDNKPEINNKNCPWVDENFTEEELQAHRDRNDSEVEELIKLVKEYKDAVIAVSIGNENTPDWTANMVPVERLIAHADRLKEALDVPVTFCEGFGEWERLHELADHLDFISLHSYPWHLNLPAVGAVEVNKEHFHTAQEWFKGKEIIFTEMGWPSRSDETKEPKQATVANQKMYIKELNEWLEEEQVVAFLFEAFDEPWKGDNQDRPERNWGLFDVNRKKKW
ncbi:MAG: hypothetical protein J6033_06245 [Lachnospiraceae bacterium]|nr:hypothetical protein [Lachnospiraceae bacterium]